MSSRPTDADCIFCKIVAGQIPCHELYQDDHVLAFLDVRPLSVGHALVVPKGHWVTLDQVPTEVGAGLGGVLPLLTRAVMRVTEAPGCNVLQNNGKIARQSVDHVHFHIIPRYDNNSGLGTIWNPGKLDADQAVELVGKLRAAL